MNHIKTFLSILSIVSISANAQEKPTMGWSSWNTFGLNINEQTIKNQALYMRQKGFQKAGYTYINIDDGFFGGRNLKTGELYIHKTRFPNGLKPVVDYIHRLGLKAGIYSDGGKNTCGNYHGGDTIAHDVGLYRFDERDCQFYFNELGFDFIKVDFCGGVDYHNSEHLNLDCETRYKAIAAAIAKTGRDDVRMNVCRWDYPGNWVHDIACSWRTTGDINCSWGSVRDILKQNLYLSAYCYGGHFNDMDMLEVGRTLSVEEDKTHFGMWCIMSSPLLIGCDMGNINTTASNLLRNTELIALNQDTLCIQAYVAQRVGDTYILVKDLENLYGNTRAVAFYNPTDEAVDMSLKLEDIDLAGSVKVRDLYQKKDLDPAEETLSVKVPAHGTRIYKLVAEKRLERILYEGECGYLSSYQEIYNNAAAETAIYEENNSASGGMVAGWLGRKANNDIQWRNVYSDNGGQYTLNIKYVSGENRNMILNVNGKDVKTFTSCNSGSWGSVGIKTITIELEPGENTIRLYNKSAWMPSIDCINIKKTGSTERVVVGIENVKTNLENNQDNAYYSLDGRKVSANKKGILIHKGKKLYNK